MIRFVSFSKSYGTHEAVRELTLTIEPGEVVALLGPNGSGKTTSLKGAAGLLSPTSGQVLIEGLAARDPLARKNLSFLPQKVGFPEALSGREVVEFYARLRGLPAERGIAALEIAALDTPRADIGNREPVEAVPARDRAVGTYSGGMTQRLGLAIASLVETGALLLDEPTAALDPHGLTAFYTLVETRRRSGQSVLFTSHQLADVQRLADRAAVLVDGRLVAVLTRAELAKNARIDDLYRDLVKAA